MLYNSVELSDVYWIEIVPIKSLEALLFLMKMQNKQYHCEILLQFKTIVFYFNIF